MDVARIEQGTESGGSRAAWTITLHLDIGVVRVPGSYQVASVAEAVARDHAATLGLQVLAATYEPSRIELRLQRIREPSRPSRSSPA